MGRSKKPPRCHKSNDVATQQDVTSRPTRPIGRWRAFSLSMVYFLFAIHILHWKVAGRSLAPLELNEVMYTLELGIITAGFLFMSLLVLGTLVFGRFFCSWACHIMVLQELCAWVLRKLGIRRKPIRSRLLLLVPLATAFYMFIWPQILRAWQAKAFPEFHFRTDSEGWASFVTSNFWRNLPSAPIIVLTFLVCGFLMVYLLGSRTFCTYVCPYGAIFALADRFSPGRLRANEKCRQCGTCTSTCTSGIRVHEELKEHGAVINSACLKCMDCVSACPQDALHYRFTAPPVLKTLRGAGRFGGLPYDFSLREEALMAVVFLAVAISFRGLYSRIPFLLSLALGAIVAFLTVTTLRLRYQPAVLLSSIILRRNSRLTRLGKAYAAIAAILLLFVCHCAFVRYHEYFGLRQALTVVKAGATEADSSLAERALTHLHTADQWGLLANERVQRSLVDVSLRLKRLDTAEAYARKLIHDHPDDGISRLKLGQILIDQGRHAQAAAELRTITTWNPQEPAAPHVVALAHQSLGALLVRQGQFEAADRELRDAIRHDPALASAEAELGSVLAEQGKLDEAIECLRRALRIDPQLAHAQYNLGTLLAQTGQLQEAITTFEAAIKKMPPDSDLHNNLGMVLFQSGDSDRALQEFERAIGIESKNANAYFNLGRLFASRGEEVKAIQQYRIAARLDSRYASLFSK